jgi:ribosomal protein L7Ae-like RNA K-turn-binding protein
MSGDTAAALRLLGLARRAGELQLGARGVLRALARREPGIVFLARDAGADLRRKIERQRGDSELDSESFDSRTLADAFGRDRLAVVSVHDAHFVAGLRKALHEPR